LSTPGQVLKRAVTGDLPDGQAVGCGSPAILGVLSRDA
jgi:hypothetical protein